MGQLLEVTAKPFKAIHFRLNGRLVPDDRLVLEKHIALARKAAFMQANNELAQPDMNYILKVNRAFSAGGGVFGSPISLPGEAAAGSLPNRPSGSSGAGSSSDSFPGRDTSSEAAAAYTQQRGSFETRVASGDVTYIPAIEMTIITSWPEVDFTYTGGFNYVPPRDSDAEGEALNLKI